MATLTSILSETELADQGGEPVVLRVDWDPADTPFTEQTPCRVVLKVRNGSGATDFTSAIPNHDGCPLYLFSGVPQQTFGGVFAIYPHTPNESETEGYREATVGGEAVLQPVFHWLRGYTPRLAPGVYYPVLEMWNGAAWAQVGGPTTTQAGAPFRVLTRCRFDEVYRHRRRSPAPYKTGPRSIDEEGAV
jgi:hypothetical protein